MRSIKSSHEKECEKSHAWQHIHGDLPKKKGAGVKASSISDEQVIEIAISMGATPNPTSDLIRMIEKAFGCSSAVAGKVYSRVLERERIQTVADYTKLNTTWKWERRQHADKNLS